MADEFSTWTASVRTQLQEELRWLTAGGKVLSPSGDDITQERIASLIARIEHASIILGRYDA